MNLRLPKMFLTNLELSSIPERPGVYFFFDGNGELIYIGKSSNLRKRIRDHTRAFSFLKRVKKWSRDFRPHSLSYFVTLSALEASQLEFQLIKAFHPKLNIKDNDEEEPQVITLDLNEKFPSLYLTSKREEGSGALYLGPFTFIKRPYLLFQWLSKRYNLRRCTAREFQRGKRACLYFQIKRCLGPCLHGEDIRELYQEKVKALVELFLGKVKPIRREILKHFWEKYRKWEYEEAKNYWLLSRILRYLEVKPAVILPYALTFEVTGGKKIEGSLWQLKLLYVGGLLKGIELSTGQAWDCKGVPSLLPSGDIYLRKIKRLLNINLRHYVTFIGSKGHIED